MDNNSALQITAALHILKNAIEQQTRQQEETNELMRSLIHALQMTGQATADLASAMVEDE